VKPDQLVDGFGAAKTGRVKLGRVVGQLAHGGLNARHGAAGAELCGVDLADSSPARPIVSSAWGRASASPNRAGRGGWPR
jgi:hypothetical protein